MWAFCGGFGKTFVKSGHVVGLGSSLVLNPSGESEVIGYVDEYRAFSGLEVAVLLTARGVSVSLGSNAPLLPGQIK
jgi:hypothetical protein